MHPDTDVTPYDMATLGSRSLFHMGNAIRRAAEDAKNKLEALAREVGMPEGSNVPIAELFQARTLPPASELGTILRRKARPILNLSKNGCHKELLTPMMPGTLQLLLVTLDPGGSSGAEHYTHKGEEAGVVLAGTLKLWIEDQVYVLKEGDSFRFKSTRQHRFENAGNQTTRVLWAMTPPIY